MNRIDTLSTRLGPKEWRRGQVTSRRGVQSQIAHPQRQPPKTQRQPSGCPDGSSSERRSPDRPFPARSRRQLLSRPDFCGDPTEAVAQLLPVRRRVTHSEQTSLAGSPSNGQLCKQHDTDNDENQNDEGNRKTESDVGAATQGLLDVDARRW